MDWKRGQKVRVVDGDGPGRRDVDVRALEGRTGVVTGRGSRGYIEVEIFMPLIGRGYGYLFLPEGLEPV